MQAAMVVSFSTPYPGREKQALEFAMESEEFWGKYVAEGKISKPEWFFSFSGKSLWIIKGDYDLLREVSVQKEHLAQFAKGELLMQDFTYDIVLTGDGGDLFMGIWGEEAAKAA